MTDDLIVKSKESVGETSSSDSVHNSILPGCDTDGDGAPSDAFAKLRMKNKTHFVKSPEDHVPLPDPFPLPYHYREDVERSLRMKSMTQQTKRSFFSAVASAMLGYKRYPSSTDYHCVYRAIIAKYPFLEADAGSQEVLFCFVGEHYV